MIHVIWLLIISFAGGRLASMFPAHRFLIWFITGILVVMQLMTWFLNYWFDKKEAKAMADINENIRIEVEDLISEPGDISLYPDFELPYRSPITGRKLNDIPE